MSRVRTIDWLTPTFFVTGVVLLCTAYYLTGDYQKTLLVLGIVNVLLATFHAFRVTPEKAKHAVYDLEPLLLLVFVVLGIPLIVKTIGEFLVR